MADDTQIVMKIPEEVIEAQVQAAVASALLDRSEDIIKSIVAAVLTEPAMTKSSYHGGRAEPVTEYRKGKRVTVSHFQQMVRKMVREVATKEVEAWIDEQRETIRKGVRAHLGRTRSNMAKRIADQIVEKLQTPHVHLTINLGDLEE